MNHYKTHYVKLSDLGKIVTGKTPPTNDESFYDGDYPFITPTDIKTFDIKYIANTDRSLSKKGALYQKRCILPEKSICFVCIGSTIGKMCMTDQLSFSNQQINTIIPNDRVDPEYLFYLLKYIRTYFQSIGGGTGSGKSIINKTVFSNSRVEFISDTNIQKRIARLLSQYDSMIDTNNKRIKLLEQMAENLYKEWFVRFRFPGYKKAEFESGIPKGWDIVRMNNFCYVTDGTHDTPAPTIDGVPLVTGKSLKEGFVDFSETYNISIKDHKQIKKRSGLKDGDILFSNIGTVGSTCVVDYDREFSVKNVIIFKLDSIEKTVYLYLWLNSKPMQDIFSMQTNGSSQQFVGLTFMRKYKVMAPQQNVLEKFCSLVNPIFEERKILHRENEYLMKQRDLLLPRLMSGKLEV
ncbi:MAG: restriction endonuclease subunit S [Ruminococcus sp.]|nr:restriction endonuclease subunit S [Ruminococcus sp.]